MPRLYCSVVYRKFHDNRESFVTNVLWNCADRELKIMEFFLGKSWNIRTSKVLQGEKNATTPEKSLLKKRVRIPTSDAVVTNKTTETGDEQLAQLDSRAPAASV